MMVIKGCSFQNCSFDGRASGLDKPEILGDPENCNVAFPANWTRAQRREWRILMDMPGHEWDGDETPSISTAKRAASPDKGAGG